MSETEAATSGNETTEIVADMEKIDEGERAPKRRKLADKQYKLEERLGGILCCAVCKDLPVAIIYQCTNGHLMCAGCFTHVLADARLRDEMATCPTCRVEISKTSATRNLAAENAVSELPAMCQYCNKDFPKNSLQKHEEAECEDRTSGCKYSRIGCPWRGPFHEAAQHETECTHPQRTGADVMQALQVIDQQVAEQCRLYDHVFRMLSYEKVTFNDLQWKPYRTDEFVHRLFYETSRFAALDHQWVVKARINNNQKDPAQSSERGMTYQLILKTKTRIPLVVYYTILSGPCGDMKVDPRIYNFEFKDEECESPYLPVPLPNTAECNRLLAGKTINFRLVMFVDMK